jgi:uncharacterized membrane protein YjjB (DUF3815 family)
MSPTREVLPYDSALRCPVGISSQFSVPGSWFLVPGSWFLVPGSWFLVPGSWFLVPGSWFLVLDPHIQ